MYDDYDDYDDSYDDSYDDYDDDSREKPQSYAEHLQWLKENRPEVYEQEMAPFRPVENSEKELTGVSKEWKEDFDRLFGGNISSIPSSSDRIRGGDKPKRGFEIPLPNNDYGDNGYEF